jgi:hypothetical protein
MQWCLGAGYTASAFDGDDLAGRGYYLMTKSARGALARA